MLSFLRAQFSCYHRDPPHFIPGKKNLHTIKSLFTGTKFHNLYSFMLVGICCMCTVDFSSLLKLCSHFSSFDVVVTVMKA